MPDASFDSHRESWTQAPTKPPPRIATARIVPERFPESQSDGVDGRRRQEEVQGHGEAALDRDREIDGDEGQRKERRARAVQPRGRAALPREQNAQTERREEEERVVGERQRPPPGGRRRGDVRVGEVVIHEGEAVGSERPEVVERPRAQELARESTRPRAGAGSCRRAAAPGRARRPCRTSGFPSPSRPGRDTADRRGGASTRPTPSRSRRAGVRA